jgi:hypothetical protein
MPCEQFESEGSSAVFGVCMEVDRFESSFGIVK